jgi:DNA-binding transcriptional ArsR family regulator
LSLASQSLRVLNARGLLLARRFGSSVYYSPCANRSIPYSAPLLQVIRKTFANDRKPGENIFRYSTAFTHPRRISIVKILSKNPMRFEDIVFKTNIPPRALGRHLRKLVVRGFLKSADDRRYIRSVPRHDFARFLLHLARHA